MTKITIREKADTENGWEATVSFDNGPEHPVVVTDPFSPEEEERLGWYFEEWIKFPFVGEVDAAKTAVSITNYGEDLFNQLFAGRKCYREYHAAVSGGFADLSFEIRGGLPFHALHWEALKDPDRRRPLAAECPFIRQNESPPQTDIPWRPAPTLNVLLVTARPRGRKDVAYRTISRPLVESLQQSRLRAQIDLVRPGTYRALHRHLEETRAKHGGGTVSRREGLSAL